MKNFIVMSSIAALLAGVAVPALAQTAETPADTQMADRDDGEGRGMGGHDMGRHGKGGHGKHGGRRMQMIDANGDGVIGDDEAASLADHMFNRIDSDSDSNLTEAEFATVGKGHRGWFNWSSAETDAVVKVRKEKFASLDADKDSKVTKTEFFADAKTRFALLDTDKDGKVTPWEFRSQN